MLQEDVVLGYNLSPYIAFKQPKDDRFNSSRGWSMIRVGDRWLLGSGPAPTRLRSVTIAL